MYRARLHLTEFARNILSTCLLIHDLLATAWFLFLTDCLKLILKQLLHVFAKIQYNNQHFGLQYRDLHQRRLYQRVVVLYYINVKNFPVYNSV